MGYNSMKSRQELEAERAAHPIWHGIGFVFMILLPILAFGISDSVIKYMKINVRGFVIPPALAVSKQILPGYVVTDFWAVVMMTALISVMVYALYSVIVAIIHHASPTAKLEDMSTNVKGQAYRPKRKLTKPK